jgi:hypothetical protein
MQPSLATWLPRSSLARTPRNPLGQTQQELQKREQRLDSVEKKLDQLIAAPQKK